MRSKRIFWMGSHKILIPTELKALQDMGYETFYPPYLGNERDQSAVYDWTCPPTSLPQEVVEKLSQYNFFWNDISDEVAELLNAHFDCVMVTINGDWLLSFLKVFTGKIIYRTFGEPYSLSQYLASNGARPIVERHADFWFMPHCIENAEKEEPWLRMRERIVPYSLTQDVLKLAGTWGKRPRDKLIGLACPNISNHYYGAHFRYLKTHFEERMFRYYGVQVDNVSDPNVVGTLDRAEMLAQFSALSGFLYTYREPNVCYLPPVEMITIGGPVLYLPGSLLDRYLLDNNAGRVANEDDAKRAARRLIAGDRAFAAEIIDSQRGVAVRYDSVYTLPIFCAALEEIFPLVDRANVQESTGAPKAELPVANEPPVLLLGHIPKAYSYSSGEYVSVHGIPRVMRRFVQVLTESGRRVTVTACSGAIHETLGFYASQTSRRDLLEVVDCDSVGLPSSDGPIVPDVRAYYRGVSESKIHWLDGPPGVLTIMRGGLVRLFSKKGAVVRPLQAHLDQYSYIVVPHYYLFPEVNEFGWAKILVYLPDFMPHFFKGRGWFSETGEHKEIGRNLAQVAKYVMTNSQFTRRYLPKSDLEVAAEKIIAFPLPHLAYQGLQSPDPRIERTLKNVDYIFYPTQPHHNKRLDLLARIFVILRKGSRKGWKLVLTCGALTPDIKKIVREAGAESDVVLFPGVSDASLAWLYQNAQCLAFTSEMEGNFPTQILEALELGCPIVTFEHPTISSELGDDALMLENAPFADLESFVDRIIYVKRNRQKILAKQHLLLEKIGDRFSYEQYRENILSLDRKMLDDPIEVQ